MRQNETKPHEYDLDKEFKNFIGIIVREKKISRQEVTKIRKAFLFAKNAHEGQFRKSGEPYISHPLAVARIVYEEMGLLSTGIICSFLHDVLEDTPITEEEIKNNFGETVLDIVIGLTKIAKIDILQSSIQVENYRKILLTISDDIRTIVIKIADRLHNMRTLGAQLGHKQLKITSETLYLYAPLAHRLGMNNIKTELEDLSLKYSQPQVYEEISNKLNVSREEAEAYIERFIRTIKQKLSMTELKIDKIESRFKSIYSIYNKIQTKGVSFEEIMDLYAIRIILEDRPGHEINDCWLAYSEITSLYKPRHDRMRDWLRTPKANGYQSLHATVLGAEGRMVEIQIRTFSMDNTARKGITSHWVYKEEKEVMVIDDNFLSFTDRVRDLLADTQNTFEEQVAAIKSEFRLDNLSVFTPKGEMKSIVKGATVLDFAYLIHSDIGNRAIGAKIMDKLVPLHYKLQQADQIEIITSSKTTVKDEWLEWVVTPRATHHIKNYLKVVWREKVDAGKMLADRFYKKMEIKEDSPEIQRLITYCGFEEIEDFYYAVGVHNRTVIAKIEEFARLVQAQMPISPPNPSGEILINPELLVLGKEINIENIVIASCCNPIKGDDIVGLQRKNKVIIHRTSCEVAIRWMANHGGDIIKANFSMNEEVSFLAALKVEGLDGQGLLIGLLNIISKGMNLNIRKVFIDSKDGQFEGLFLVFIKSLKELNELTERLRRFPNVKSVTRTDSSFSPFEN